MLVRPVLWVRSLLHQRAKLLRCLDTGIGQRDQLGGRPIFNRFRPIAVGIVNSQSAEILEQFGCVLVAILGVLLQQLMNDAAQPGRQVGAQVFQSLRLSTDVLHRHSQRGITLERRSPGKNVKRGYAERIEIAACV